MIGYLLLLVSILAYLSPRKRYLSYFIYLSFMMGTGGGFGLWTDDILGVKNGDLAVIYSMVVSIIMILRGQYRLPKWSFITQYKWFITFLTVSVLFSFVYYHFSVFQILQGGRSFLLIFSLPILTNVKEEDFWKVFNLLLKICLLTSVLYILQTVTRRALMPYGEFSIDDSTGLPRFYNAPANLEIFLTLTFLKPELFKRHLLACRIILFAALICTLGRTFIISSMLMVLLVFVLNGKFKKVGSTVVALGIIAMPFIGMVSSRFTTEGTSDFESISAGDFKEGYADSHQSGTMLYRFAWVYERFDYIIDRPIPEQLFGLGFISDSQPWVNQHYRFRVGLENPYASGCVQLTTPDISYGNMLTRLGFLGSAIYIAFIVSIIVFAFKRRKVNDMILLTSAGLIIMFVNSFSGASMSETKSLAIYFLFLSLLLNNNTNKQSVEYDKDNSNHLPVQM